MNSATISIGDTAAASQYSNMRKDLVQNAGDYAATTGSANAYLLTVDSQFVLAAGVKVRLKANFANTSAATLNVNGGGAVAIKKLTSVALIPNDILNGQICELVYDGTNWQLQTALGNTIVAGFNATAGENVDGTTTPQTVMISDGTNSRTSGRYYKADVDDVTNMGSRFDGFVINNVTTGNTDFIITDGIVGGFTGLTVGARQFLDTTAGGRTETNTGVQIGVAISTTQILIQKEEKRYGFGTDSWTVTGNGQTKTVTHNLGRLPKHVKVYTGGGNPNHAISIGAYDSSGSKDIYFSLDTNQVQLIRAGVDTKIMSVYASGAETLAWNADITSINATTFVMTSGGYISNPGTIEFFWEVFA